MFLKKTTGGSVIDTCFCVTQQDTAVIPSSISHGIARPGYAVTYVRETYILHTVIGGTAVIDGLTVGAGDVFLLRPMISHKIEITGDVPLEQYWIEFVGDGVPETVDYPYFSACSIYRGIDLSPLYGLLHEAVYGGADDRACVSRQLGLIHLILSLLPQRGTDTDKTGRRYVRRAMDFLRLNLSKGVTVSDAACAVGLSERYLYRLFLRETGMTPIDYLAGCRIDAAKELLKSTPLGVSEIACAVGIADQSYFSRFFKQSVGCKPSEYRKAQRR